MGMEKYMGIQAGTGQRRSERELPTVNISGIPFYADIVKHEFREVTNPANRISMGGIKEEFGFSHFLFDRQTRNIYTGDHKGDLPGYVDIILVPPVKDLDPVGLARRYGYRDDYFISARKVEHMVLTALTRAQKQDEAMEQAHDGKKIRNKQKF